MSKTKFSTLCYIEKDEKYLMLHRTVKNTMLIRTSGSAWEDILNTEKAGGLPVKRGKRRDGA